jgi:hypothetical protein
MRDFVKIQDTNDIDLYLSHYQHTDTISSTTSFQDALFSNFSDSHSELTHYSDLPVDDLYLYKKYIEALNSAHPLPLFESIAKEGSKHYDDFHPLIQKLVSFAQYRAGCLLGPRGLEYLTGAAKNGNTDAFYMLGVLAERRHDLEAACDFYYQATGNINAILAFAHLVLFRNVPHYTTQQALDLLVPISQKVKKKKKKTCINFPMVRDMEFLRWHSLFITRRNISFN